MRIPSKTFLLGEYAVLAGGSGLIVSTTPSFEFVKEGEGRSLSTYAGPLQTLLSEDSRNHKMIDPHGGRGGFGASSAALLFAWQMAHGSRDPWPLVEWMQKNVGSSGADVVAQFYGGVSHVDMTKRTGVRYEWPWLELGFSIFRTGHKLETHRHLAQLSAQMDAQADIRDLVSLAREGCAAFQNEHGEKFLAILRLYTEALAEKGWVADSTAAILNLVARDRDVLAAKGCGAMGADTILVLHKTVQATALRLRLEALASVEFVAGHEDMTSGFSKPADIEQTL